MSNAEYADVAELADALASGASDRKVMWVQVPSSAPYLCNEIDIVSKKSLIRQLIRDKILYSSKTSFNNHKMQVNQRSLPPMNRILFKVHGSKFKPNPVYDMR